MGLVNADPCTKMNAMESAIGTATAGVFARLAASGRTAEMVALARVCGRLSVDEDGCWLWPGALREGYGRATMSGKQVNVHRFVYEALVGPIGEQTLDHLCRARACANPAHLEPVSRAVNIQRSWRDNPGRPHPNAAKTNCPRGHEYTEATTRATAWGRKCRICEREIKVERRLTDPAFLEAERTRRRRYYAESGRSKGRGPSALRTHCPHGHEYTPENTYVTPKGERQCRECKRAAHRRWEAKQRAS